jgi:hypothetical protein
MLFYSAIAIVLLARGVFWGASVRWHPILLVPAGLALVSVFQTVPLPVSWVEFLSPQSASSRQALGELLGQVSSAFPLTMDLTATYAAAARWWTLALAMFLLLHAYRDRHLKELAPMLVVYLGLFSVVLAISQYALGSNRIYGLFETTQASARPLFSAPFIAPNHTGQFLLLAFMSLVGASSELKPEARTGRLSVYGAVLMTGLVLTQSRGALIGLALGTLLVVGVSIHARRLRRSRVAFQAAALAGLGLSVLVLWIGDLRDFILWDQVAVQLNIEKLGYQELGFGLLGEFPWTGVGADAFGAIQVAVLPLDTSQRFSFVENDYLQVFLDFGVVLPVVLVGGALLWSRRRGSARKKRRTKGVWVVVVGVVALQSLVTFALLSLGLTIAVGAIVGARLIRSRSLKGRFRVLPVFVIALGLTLVIATKHPSFASRAGTEECRDATCLSEVLSARPLDGRHLWRGVVHGEQAGMTEAVQTRLAMHALELSGNDIGLHLAGAEYFRLRGDMIEAWFNIHRVLESGGSSITLVREWVSATPNVADLIRVSRDRPALAEPILAQLVSLDRPELALMLAVALPDSFDTLAYRVRASRMLGEPPLAQAWVERLLDAYPEHPTACQLAASIGDHPSESPATLDEVVRCIDANVDEPSLELSWLTYVFVEWATWNDDVYSERQGQLERVLSDFNVWSVGDLAIRVVYRRASILVNARGGHCRTAQLAVTSIHNMGHPTPDLPYWIDDACPGVRP